jgi:hypothetical protein
MSIEQKNISSQLQELIEKLKTSVLKSKAIYEEFVEEAKKEGFNDLEIDMLLKHHLKGIVPDRTLKYYKSLYLSSSRSGQIVQNDDKKVIEDSSSDSDKVNITTAYDIKEAETTEPEEFKPSASMEEFRKQHGTVEQEQQPQEQEEPEEIYDKQFVDRLIKENAQLVNSFTFEYDLEVKDQILPLKVTCYPDKKTGYVRLDKGRLKK